MKVNIGDESQTSYGKERKARKAIATARQWFAKRGLTLLPEKHCFSNGSDIVVVNGSDIWSVEVKPAQKADGYWRTNPVYEKRKSDDLVAIVFPCGYVLVEPMKDHLKSCNKSGQRKLNKMFFTTIAEIACDESKWK